MKFTLPYLILLLLIVSCKKGEKTAPAKRGLSGYELEQRGSKEITKFEKELIQLYVEAEKDPKKTIVKADNLLKINENEKDEYRSLIKTSITNKLNYLKAELYYKIGQYNNSLGILEKNKNKHTHIATAIAANYTKLKQFDKAKIHVDRIGKGCYIYNYVLGNYYETIGDKKEALKIYNAIKLDKKTKHYAYYQLTLNRLEELNKSNPKFLNELYFPTGHPSYEIAHSDNENRSKIFDLIGNLPECKDLNSLHIYESPQINDKDYYWIKAGTLRTVPSTEEPKVKYNFFVYPKDFSIKYYDEENDKLLSLEEWRKNN
jgi:hypothetical protein